MLKNISKLATPTPLAVIGGHVYQLKSLPSFTGGNSNLTTDYFQAIPWHKGLPTLFAKRIKTNFAEYLDIRRQFLNECQIINSLTHPQLPQRYGRHDTDGLLLAYHWFNCTPLYDWLYNTRSDDLPIIDTASIHTIIKQLLTLISYLHEKHQPVIHGQINLHNILINDQQQLTLVGFNQARFAHTTQIKQIIYTQLPQAASLSPEQARGDSWGLSSDYFQLGLLYYQLLTRTPWIEGESRRQQQLYAANLSTPDVNFLNHIVEKRISNLIAALLHPDPIKRPCLSEIKSQIFKFPQH